MVYVEEEIADDLDSALARWLELIEIVGAGFRATRVRWRGATQRSAKNTSQHSRDNERARKCISQFWWKKSLYRLGSPIPESCRRRLKLPAHW